MRFPNLREIDREYGWLERRVPIAHIKKPPGLCLTLNGVPLPAMATVRCDQCNKPIPDGEPACAVTQWRDAEPGPWENQYQ